MITFHMMAIPSWPVHWIGPGPSAQVFGRFRWTFRWVLRRPRRSRLQPYPQQHPAVVKGFPFKKKVGINTSSGAECKGNIYMKYESCFFFVHDMAKRAFGRDLGVWQKAGVRFQPVPLN